MRWAPPESMPEIMFMFPGRDLAAPTEAPRQVLRIRFANRWRMYEP